MSDRYCPICDESTDALDCAKHHVPTVLSKPGRASVIVYEAGEVIDGKFTVTRLLGSGAMGTVYEVGDRDGKLWALKAIKLRDDGAKQMIRRFYREAVAVRKLSHPGIVKISHLGVDDKSGQPYQVMEYCDGKDLLDFHESAPLKFEQVMSLARQLLDALNHAHSHGVVHRDLKPENLMVNADEEGSLVLKVLDFGIAKILEHDGDAPTLTATGVAVGTPHYMSPEQAKGQKVSPASDLYSAACLIFELLTDRPPFHGDDFMSVLLNHVRGPIPDVPEVNFRGEPIPQSVRDTIRMTLAKEPKERPPSAAIMIELLEGGARIDDLVQDEPAAEASPKALTNKTKAIWICGGAVIIVALLALFAR